MFANLLLTLFFINVGLSTGKPAMREYHYISGNNEVRRSDCSIPAQFNSIPIGAVELDSNALPGSVHLLSDGHHFYHRGWCISSRDGGGWEFLPGLNTNLKTVSRKQARGAIVNAPNEGLGCQLVVQGMQIDSISKRMARVTIEDSLPKIPVDINTFEQRLSVSSLTSGAESVSTGNQWQPLQEITAIDLFDAGAFVTSSTAQVGDFLDIFFDVIKQFS